MINVGVIGLLVYLLGARLNGKALAVTSLDWEDCECFWAAFHWNGEINQDQMLSVLLL